MVVNSTEQLMAALRADMRKKKLKATQLAAKAGVSNVTLSHWLAGRNGPTLAPLLPVLDALGLEMHVRRKGEQSNG